MLYTRKLHLKVGLLRGERRVLTPEEGLYLVEMRREKVQGERQQLWKADLRYYFAYRAWRERGLLAFFEIESGRKTPSGILPYSSLHLPRKRLRAIRMGEFFVVEGERWLYDEYWFGQFGMYKKGQGKFLYLDPYEARFLAEEGLLEETPEPSLYPLFAKWRRSGWVVKSGYKFGTPFRIYPPGTKPGKKSHSSFLLDAPNRGIHWWEVSRAVRLAHGVRKGYLLPLPNEEARPRVFTGYGRKAEPEFLIAAFSETDEVKVSLLAGLLKEAEQNQLVPCVAVADREGGCTFYSLKKLLLKEEPYLLISWINP